MMISHKSEKEQTKLPGIFRSFQYRNYRLFFAGQSLSLIGTWIQQIALPWLVYHITGSPIWLGVVGFATQIPIFLLAPFAGVLTDRWNRLRILITTQTLAMVQAFILALLYYTHVIHIWHIIVLGIFLGIVNAFDMPSRQSLVIKLVEKREDLGNAIALNSSMVNAARLIGPSIAGVLVAVTSEGFCFLLNGVSFFFVIISLLMMNLKTIPAKNRTSRMKDELTKGFSYVFRFVPLRNIILLLALVSLMGSSYAVLMPVFTKEVLHGSSATFGFLMASSGFGALVGAFYLASRKKLVGLESFIPLSAFLFGIGLVSVALTRVMTLSAMSMLIVGFGMTTGMASSNTIIQTITDDDKRGRVMSFYTMAFIGTVPFGSLLAGTLAHRLGAPHTLMIGGSACILGAAIYLANLSAMKRIIQPVYERLGLMHQKKNVRGQ